MQVFDDPEGLEVVVAKARELITQLGKPNGGALKIVTLKPRDEDYERVFLGAAAASARAGYAGLWASPPPWPAKPDQTQLRIGGAYPEDFATDNPRTRPFPGGYKDIAHHLVRGRVWIVFELVAPGQSAGVQLDGLVSLGDHFAWFPKPWRVVPQ